MRAGQAKRMAQEIRQRQPHLRLGFVTLAVDQERDLARFSHTVVLSRSSPRKRGSSHVRVCNSWIPACAGMSGRKTLPRLLNSTSRHDSREMLPIRGRRMDVVKGLEL